MTALFKNSIRLAIFIFTLLLQLTAIARSEPATPAEEPINLKDILELANITDQGDINADGIPDYIITYNNSASNYGEFLYNVIISDSDSYRKGFKEDDYFVNLKFQGALVIGIRREAPTTARHQYYIYNATNKSLEEK